VGSPIFFKGVQKKLREQSVRNVYGLGFQLTTNGGDPNVFFDQWLLAYGGQNIVSKTVNCTLMIHRVREAAIKALTYPTTAYKEGFGGSGGTEPLMDGFCRYRAPARIRLGSR
jgi:hypothetical protein